MYIKNFILILFVGLPFFAFSQDVIYTIGGDELKAKVTENSDNDIEYRKFDNLNGPSDSMSKSKIYMIIYENGLKEKFVNAPEVAKVEKIEPQQVKPAKQAIVEQEPRAKTNNQDTIVEEPVQKLIESKKALVEISVPDSESPKRDDGNSGDANKKVTGSIQTIFAKPSKSANGAIAEQTILEKPTAKSANAVANKSEKVTIEEPVKSEPIIKKNSGVVDTNYRRSSLYTMMITDPSRQNEEDIKSYFVEKLTPEKYNNHNLSERYINASSQRNELDNIVEHLKRNKIAHQLIAKWYGRSAEGDFNMDLIKKRGFYDASIMNIKKLKIL